MLAGAKASSLMNTPVVVGDPYARLERALRRHLVNALGDPDRDIDDLTTLQDETGCLYRGTWQGHLRLTAGVAVDTHRVADVLLIATKGMARADETLFGRVGARVGNSLLVGRLLHVAAFALRSAAVVGVRNVPYDLRVRRLYEDMGFRDGDYLALEDLASATKMFAYVEGTYRHLAAAGRLSLASPPPPL